VKLAWALINIMNAIHHCGILHNDLSKYNIMLHFPLDKLDVVYKDPLATWARVIVKKVALSKRVMPMAMENLSIAQHQDTLQYAHTQGGTYKLKVRQFDVSDFIYLQRQPNDILDTSSGHIILRIEVIRALGVLELQGVNGRTIRDHSKNCAPCHLLNLNPTITHQLGFFHLTIHVRYVKGQTMLIRCCFEIIVMVDTIYSTLSRNSLKFSSAFGTVHHVFLQHLDFYLNHTTLFPVQV